MSKDRVTDKGWWALLFVLAGLSLAVMVWSASVLNEMKESVDGKTQISGWVNEYGTPVPEPTQITRRQCWTMTVRDSVDGPLNYVCVVDHDCDMQQPKATPTPEAIWVGKEVADAVGGTRCMICKYTVYHGEPWTDHDKQCPPMVESTIEDMDIAAALVAGFAGKEASRVAKKAYIMMGMGGEYVADCEAVYDSAKHEVVVKYSITWHRKVDKTMKRISDIASVVNADEEIKQTWYGATWNECIVKMMAWRGGE